MKTGMMFLAAFAMAFLVLGCTTGIIYTHTYQPLTLDMHKTPMVTNSSEGDIKHLSIPFTYLSVASDSNAIGDIARKNGLKELYFADLETRSFFTIWNQYWVHVYGK